MAKLEPLIQKYQPVLHTLETEGARVQPLNLEGDQLALTTTVASGASKNRVWDSIKSVDPTCADVKHNIQVVPASGFMPYRAAPILPKSATISTATPIDTLTSPRPTALPTPTKSELGRS
jgi:hypothetical protein